MIDPTFYLTMAAAGLAALAMVVTAGLAGWRGWLTLKGRELDRATAAAPTAGARIEIADLKERIRRLEAIAAGVDL